MIVDFLAFSIKLPPIFGRFSIGGSLGGKDFFRGGWEIPKRACPVPHPERGMGSKSMPVRKKPSLPYGRGKKGFT